MVPFSVSVITELMNKEISEEDTVVLRQPKTGGFAAQTSRKILGDSLNCPGNNAQCGVHKRGLDIIAHCTKTGTSASTVSPPVEKGENGVVVTIFSPTTMHRMECKVALRMALDMVRLATPNLLVSIPNKCDHALLATSIVEALELFTTNAQLDCSYNVTVIEEPMCKRDSEFCTDVVASFEKYFKPLKPELDVTKLTLRALFEEKFNALFKEVHELEKMEISVEKFDKRAKPYQKVVMKSNELHDLLMTIEDTLELDIFSVVEHTPGATHSAFLRTKEFLDLDIELSKRIAAARASQ